MIDVYGTIGPACADVEILTEMFRKGMTGMRLNTSHISVEEAAPQIAMIHEAAARCGQQAKILIDMQGPELRIGKLQAPMELKIDDVVGFRLLSDDGDDIPVPKMVYDALMTGQQVLLDDGKILLEMVSDHEGRILRGGTLTSGKSIAIPGSELRPPAMTEQDYANIAVAEKYGITGVMQPFVRDAGDLKQVKEALNRANGSQIKLFAKIENMSGVKNLESFFELADEIVIARGDLGNAMPLWELPAVQKDIARRCRQAHMPFMVVTQMLASMEHSAVPTRAEVSDIYNALCDGAASIMVTGETAVGDFPIEVIRYLANVANTYQEE